MPRRIDDRPLPQVTVVDMKQEPFQRQQRAIFSHDLRRKMQDRLNRGEKIILLQNRRGFAPFIGCTACGEPIQCRSCRVSLTYHRRPTASETRCHYCDFAAPPPSICPSCGSPELRFDGVGTQRVESALLAQFPGIRVIRMDVDTTAWKGAHDVLVERFRSGEADVLLGTQMIAKGLDLPEVTLVGVISADTGLHLPDFRAAERSFQLLTQVAGRSGRGHTAGEVVIQTLLPDDAVLCAAARQNYAAFVHSELAQRQQAGFPPFGRLIVFRWRGPCEQAVETGAQQGVEALRQGLDAAALVLGAGAGTAGAAARSLPLASTLARLLGAPLAHNRPQRTAGHARGRQKPRPSLFHQHRPSNDDVGRPHALAPPRSIAAFGPARPRPVIRHPMGSLYQYAPNQPGPRPPRRGLGRHQAAGVLRYDQQTQAYTRFTRRNGLPGNLILSLSVDASGHLWFGTHSQGLSRYRPEQDRFDPPFLDFQNLRINASSLMGTSSTSAASAASVHLSSPRRRSRKPIAAWGI